MKSTKKFFVLYILLSAFTLVFFGCKTHKPLKTTPTVNLNKYQGRWYEISTIPIRAQKGCKCTYAEYTVTDKGYVKVYNHCIKKGKAKDITGKAFVRDSTSNAKLAVQFFWPFKGDYWILAIDANYQWVIVGAPSRDNLWILSRTPTMPNQLYNNLLTIAQSKGFDTSRLVKTVQDCK